MAQEGTSLSPYRAVFVANSFYYKSHDFWCLSESTRLWNHVILGETWLLIFKKEIFTPWLYRKLRKLEC